MSQRVAQILKSEAVQCGVVVAGQRYYLESLAHFARHQQTTCLAGATGRLHSTDRFSHEALYAGRQQEAGLRAEARHVETRREPGFGDPREIDPGGDVLDADIDVGIVVSELFKMTPQGAVHALWMIVVRTRQAVVE